MASIVDKTKDWWEGKAPREQNLLKILGATVAVMLLVWVAMTVQGGLDKIADKNRKSREALVALDLHRALSETNKAAQSTVRIPQTPVSMDTYLDEIITGLGLPSASYPTPKEQNRGAYVEQSLRLKLEKLNIEQLRGLLSGIETKNPAVAITELHVEHTFGQKETLDVDMTIVAYHEKVDEKPADSGDADKEDN